MIFSKNSKWEAFIYTIHKTNGNIFSNLSDGGDAVYLWFNWTEYATEKNIGAAAFDVIYAKHSMLYSTDFMVMLWIPTEPMRMFHPRLPVGKLLCTVCQFLYRNANIYAAHFVCVFKCSVIQLFCACTCVRNVVYMCMWNSQGGISSHLRDRIFLLRIGVGNPRCLLPNSTRSRNGSCDWTPNRMTSACKYPRYIGW